MYSDTPLQAYRISCHDNMHRYFHLCLHSYLYQATPHYTPEYSLYSLRLPSFVISVCHLPATIISSAKTLLLCISSTPVNLHIVLSSIGIKSILSILVPSYIIPHYYFICTYYFRPTYNFPTYLAIIHLNPSQYCHIPNT